VGIEDDAARLQIFRPPPGLGSPTDMPDKRDRTTPEEHRGEHNEIHYYNADEEETFDERGSQTEGQGEDERPPEPEHKR
jgi:hypothetical protein